MGQDFPRGVLVQPKASSLPDSRERSSELASGGAKPRNPLEAKFILTGRLPPWIEEVASNP
jgi:hypothetical protein